MSSITAIRQQRNKDRMNIYLDGKFGFGIDIDNFAILNLKVGNEYTGEEIEKIINKAEFQKTLEKLLRFAYLRPRSEKEIRGWLYRRKVPDVMHFDLFSKLKYFDLLDDEKFARMWVESRISFRPKPKRILTQELKLKGVNREIIDKVLGEIEIDENKLAKNLLQKRELHWKRYEKGQVAQKMTAYLISKGFNFEIAKRAVSEACGLRRKKL
jgi:regulatory protein